MPTQDIKAATAAFKKKHGRNPTQSERNTIQQNAYKKAAAERARKKLSRTK